MDKELIGLELEDKLSRILFEEDSSDSDEVGDMENVK